MVANLAFVGCRLFAGTFTACPQNDDSILGLIRGNPRALRHDLARILVQRARLRQSLDRLLHLRVGFQLHLEAFLLAKRR